MRNLYTGESALNSAAVLDCTPINDRIHEIRHKMTNMSDIYLNKRFRIRDQAKNLPTQI